MLPVLQPGDRLTLAQQDDESSFSFALTGARGPVARFLESSMPDHLDVQLEGAGGSWRMAAYGSGWKLAVTEQEHGEPVAWYTGHRIRAGGELIVAPDRAYAVTSRRLKSLDWRVHEGGVRLLSVRGRARRGFIPTQAESHFDVEVLGRPAQEADLPVLTTVMVMVAFLAWRSNLSGDVGGGFGGA